MRFSALLVGLVLYLSPRAHAQAPSAVYEVTFTSTWSSSTHPQDFPSNPHFSGLIGGIHTAAVNFWMPGAPASGGIEQMAETGVKTNLGNEVEAAIAEGTAVTVLSGGGIGTSPGSVSLMLEIDTSASLVTLVSMVAPSPDWFVGVHDLDLFEDGEWVAAVEITLEVYDAGTDSGPTYTSANDDTQPPKEISLLQEGPFSESGEVGTFLFVRKNVLDAEEELPEDAGLMRPFPNPARGQLNVPLSAEDAGRPIDIVLYDVLGRPVRDMRGVTGGTSVRLEVHGLQSGYYIVQVETGVLVRSHPVLIIR